MNPNPTADFLQTGKTMPVSNPSIVRAVSTSNIAALSGAATVDGVVLATGDHVLLTGQSTASQNGVWRVNIGTNAPWTRPRVFSTDSICEGMVFQVAEGTTYGTTIWMMTTTGAIGAIVVGTTSLAFQQMLLTNGSLFSAQGTMTFAQANAGLQVVADAAVPTGKKAYVEGWQMSVGGATAWSATSVTTKILLQDSSAVELAECAISNLTGSALVGTGIEITKVLLKAASMNAGATASKGLQLIGNNASNDLVAGSTISYRVWGRFQ